MNKQNTFPCPVSLHSNNGFDIARKMKKHNRKQHSSKAETTHNNRPRIHKYIARTTPGDSERITFHLKQPSINSKIIAAAAIILLLTGVWLTLKFSLKIIFSAMCGIPLILLFTGIFFTSDPIKKLIDRLTAHATLDL